jgi:hypothetical protein
MAPAGARRPSVMGGADTEIGAAEADGSAVERGDADVELKAGADGPAGAD